MYSTIRVSSLNAIRRNFKMEQDSVAIQNTSVSRLNVYGFECNNSKNIHFSRRTPISELSQTR